LDLIRATAARSWRRPDASNTDDAADAYQRGLEVLLTMAPTTHEVDLVRWLKKPLSSATLTPRSGAHG
jgi:hypothetical protein